MRTLTANMASSRLTGGQLLAQTLADAGVDKVFGLHGGHLEAFYKGCRDLGIQLIDFRHEASAGHAADAYARVTGKLGVCVVTSGPGFTNAVSAIANAYTDRSSVLFIIGAPPLRELETNELQGGFDQIAIGRPITKWAFRVTQTERIPDQAAQAIRKAMNGPRGPVLLELPVDVLHMSAAAELCTRPTGLAVRGYPAPTPAQTKALVQHLAASKRPVIIVGGEARFSGCEAALLSFAERSGIPVFWDQRGAGLMPPKHYLAAGDSSLLMLLSMQQQQQPDVILLLGARQGMYQGGRTHVILPADAQILQVHSDAGEIGRIHEVTLGVVADARSTLEALSALDVSWPDWTTWQTQTGGLQATLRQVYGAAQVEVDGHVHPHHAVEAVVDSCRSNTLFVLDGGEAAVWPLPFMHPSKAGGVLTHGYLGCLGIGPGMALGASFAAPDHPVVLITGDGAFGFHLQELDTMRRFGKPVVTVVLNNRKWGMSQHGQRMILGTDARYSLMTSLGDTSYAAVARGFGCHGETVHRHHEVGPAMQRAIASGLPAVVEIMTAPDVAHPVTAMMVGEVRPGSADVLIPYYENIPGDR